MIKKSEVTSILLAGVGGQGILKASDIMCEVLMAAGCDVKKSEVHGMAQRGGCVTSHVRYGHKVYSPLEKTGSVNVLLSFEKMEVLRYLHYLDTESAIIVNSEKINPPAVNIGASHYPIDFIDNLQKKFRFVQEIDAATLAKKAGSIKTANIVLLGALSKLMDIDFKIWLKIIEISFPEKLVKMNIDAFQMGINA
ncbi:MAG TPA: indolepyruvate oxidoreductase subunit beta [Smithellaceae bacterium]|nr:indolepyruvate oxidoreductase subunit beta [Smithellaceae bacterium]HRS88341.1 indolepyruvate oxidoreductase subunit beta [Smithellaceae bacterium]HRV24986.1 indolepyruvate oxidoreductase subunit beta [Smithellaceae bacterium]